MSLRTLLLLFCLTVVVAARAQRPFGRLLVGTATGYVFDTQPAVDGVYHELTWDKRLLVGITPRIYFGIQHRNIFTREASILTPPNQRRYDMVSVLGQYRVPVDAHVTLFGELAWSRGDYCTCGPQNPYRLEATQYGGLGVGIDYALRPRLALTGNFILQRILNHPTVPFRYGYNFYALGLQYAMVNH